MPGGGSTDCGVTGAVVEAGGSFGVRLSGVSTGGEVGAATLSQLLI